MSSCSAKEGKNNFSMVDDPWHLIIKEKMSKNYFNPAKQTETLTELMDEGLPSWVAYANEQGLQDTEYY